MSTILSDLRYALRQCRLSPVFTATAVLTLALGIGGTTAIFSLIHAVMLRSLPVIDPSTLYRVGKGTDCCVEGGPQDEWGMVSYPLFQKIQANAPEFEQLTAFQAAAVQWSVRRSREERLAQPMRGEMVTGNYFSTFGIGSFAGRVLTADDDRPGAAPVAVLSYHAWRTAYHADPTVVGSTFVVEDHPVSIVGIAPPGFYGDTLRSDPPALWLPLHQEPLIDGRATRLEQPISAWLRVIGRLRPGTNTTALSARLTSLLRHWIETDSGYPAVWMPMIRKMIPKQNLAVVPAGSGVEAMKEDYGASLRLLLAVCGLVLLIACSNVANLLLSRAMSRRAQTSLRFALGASRARLIRQSLTECILLALVGGLAGLLVADVAGRLLLYLAFHSDHLVAIDTAPSVPVLAFTFAISLLTGVLFGTAPAWFAARSNPSDVLRGSNRSTRDGSSLARNAFLVTQATFSVVLIAGATMLTRSLNNLEGQNFGFTVADRVEVELNPPPATYGPERLDALYRNLETRLAQTPGIEHAGLAMYNPLTDNWGEIVFLQGQKTEGGFNEDSSSSWDRVSTGYFRALGQRLLRGRQFSDADSGTRAGVAIVNQAFVNRFFPHSDPLDKHFGIDLPEAAGTFRIVGVVETGKYATFFDKPRPMFFAPLLQHEVYPQSLMAQTEIRSHFIGGLMLHTRMPIGTLEPLVRKVLSDTDPNLTLIHVRSLRDQIALNYDQQRAVASLASLFGGVALLLAAVGLYGVTAYAVTQRTAEIGVRMALGARRENVIRLVLSGAFQKVAIGLLLGIPLAIAAGRLIASKLYNVSSADPTALAIAIGALASCAFVAALIPAFRAAGLDPIRALRVE